MDLKEVVSHSLVSKTKGFLEQPSNTSLLQSSPLKNAASLTVYGDQFTPLTAIYYERPFFYSI